MNLYKLKLTAKKVMEVEVYGLNEQDAIKKAFNYKEHKTIEVVEDKIEEVTNIHLKEMY